MLDRPPIILFSHRRKYWNYSTEQATLTTPDPKRESSPNDLSSRSPSLSDEDLPEVPDRDTQPHSGMSREDLIVCCFTARDYSLTKGTVWHSCARSKQRLGLFYGGFEWYE
jgi:hypothetical protein